MPVIGKVPLNVFIHVGVLVPIATILLCYTLAVSLGHVPVWLPMISDCAVFSPEKYPFRWGIVLGAALFGAQSVLVYGADKPYSKSKVALTLGLLASFCLSVVGVVNEAEDNSVHSAGAVIFYVSYEINMAVLTWLTPQYAREDRPSNVAYFLRQCCVILTAVALIVFACLSPDWSQYKLYIAICEWFATFMILFFNWSFAADFSKYSVGEVEDTSIDFSSSGQSKRTAYIPYLV